MFDRIFKVIMVVLLTLYIFVLWIKVDTDTDEYDDPNTVSIEYECDKLDEYENVPSEVVEECKDRSTK